MANFYRSFETRVLSNHQAVEEGVVALQGLAKVFSRDILTLVPLPLQRAAFVAKHLGNLLDHLRHQRIRLLDSRTRFVHKLALDLIPAHSIML
jgi:hypothetical protein